MKLVNHTAFILQNHATIKVPLREVIQDVPTHGHIYNVTGNFGCIIILWPRVIWLSSRFNVMLKGLLHAHNGYHTLVVSWWIVHSVIIRSFVVLVSWLKITVLIARWTPIGCINKILNLVNTILYSRFCLLICANYVWLCNLILTKS